MSEKVKNLGFKHKFQTGAPNIYHCTVTEGLFLLLRLSPKHQSKLKAIETKHFVDNNAHHIEI